VGATRGHDLKWFRKRVNFNAENFRIGNCVWDDLNMLPGWVVSGEIVNEFKGNLDNYLRDNRGFK